MRKVTKGKRGSKCDRLDNRKVMNSDVAFNEGDKYDASRSKPNDWRWYAQNEQLLKDSASFPYSWPLGNRLNLGEYAPEVNKGSLPGVMAIYTSPTFGWSDNANSPINVAARNIYSYVRHANSGHANYDAPDLMLYLCAMDSMYSYLAYLKRIYGVMSTYSYTNRYYPKAVIRAMGVDFDDIQANLADFRGFINTFAVKVGSMCIPASMSYMAKHMWMYSGLYTDSNQDKAQTYLFVPYTLGIYELTDEAGSISMWGLGGMGDDYAMKFAELRAFANKMLDPVLQSEDMNIMSGDILKAFGANGVYKVEGINEQYTVLPAYQPEVLDQIQNCTLIGAYAHWADREKFPDRPTLKQDPTKGWLEFTPPLSHPYAFTLADEENPGQNVFCANRIVTFDHGDITPANTMEATRMTNIADEYIKDGTNAYNVTTMGSEIAHFAIIWSYGEKDGVWDLVKTDGIYVGLTHMVSVNGANYTDKVEANLSASQVAANRNAIKAAFSSDFMAIRDALSRDAILVERMSQFSRHPAVAITTGIQDMSTGEYHVAPAYGRFNGFVFDVNYYAVIDKDDLRVMSETALMSMFNITQYGRAAQ